jgi:hypothetical protein
MSLLLFFSAAKIRIIKCKTKKLVSFFAETVFFRLLYWQNSIKKQKEAKILPTSFCFNQKYLCNVGLLSVMLVRNGQLLAALCAA